MADASREDVTSQDQAKLGLTAFTFRSQRYQVPSVTVNEGNVDDPNVMLDVRYFCPHCRGPCKELNKAGHAPGFEGYHSLERQVHRNQQQQQPRSVQRVLPNKDARSLQASLANAMAERNQSRVRSQHSASEPRIGPDDGRDVSFKQYKRQHSGENTSNSPKVTVRQTFEQQQGSARTDSPQFTVRHSVKQSSASYSSSSPVPKPKPIPKPKPRVKPKSNVSNGQGEQFSPTSPLSPTSPTAYFSTTSEPRVMPPGRRVSPSAPGSMSRSDYGSMDRSPTEDIEVSPMDSVGNLIKKFSTSESEASETPVSPRTPTSPHGRGDRNSGPPTPEKWKDQKGAAKFVNDVPNTQQAEDVDMLRAFGFHVLPQGEQHSPTSPDRRETKHVNRSPLHSPSDYKHAETHARPLADYHLKVKPTTEEEVLIQELLNDEDITSEEEFIRAEFLAENSLPRQRPPPVVSKQKPKTAILPRVTNEFSGSSDVLSADSEAGEDVIGLEKDVLGDSLIGNVSEQPMLHEESPERVTENGREQTFSDSSDELDNAVASAMDASECETGDESIRSVSPEIDLDIALESAETEVFSNDATLGRVFSVRSEKRQYSLVKVYSKDKKSKSRSKSSRGQSSSSSMENIIEEGQGKRTEKQPPKTNDPKPGPSVRRPPSPDTVFENLIESLDGEHRLDFTSDYESDQKDYPLSSGEPVSPRSQNGVTDVVDSEINPLDIIGGTVNRRTSSCECVVDHLTQDTESSLEPLGSSIGTREDTDFSPDEYGTESDASDPNVLESGDKSVEQIIDNTRYLTDNLLATLEASPETIKKTEDTPLQSKREPPPVPKRSYVFCETSFVGTKPSNVPAATEQKAANIETNLEKQKRESAGSSGSGAQIPDMDKIYKELSEREKKRPSPPKEILSLHRTTTKEPARAQETLYAYDEVCAPKSPVIHRTPVYAKIQRIPQFLAEEFAHTITNQGDTMQLESERMHAAQYQNYQEEIEKRIPDIEVSAVPAAASCSEEEVDTADIDKEFEDNLRVFSYKKGDDVSSDLGSIMDGLDDDNSSRENVCDAKTVAETEQSAPMKIEPDANPETIKHAYQAAQYVTKMVDKGPVRKEKIQQEEKTEVVTNGDTTTQVDNWTHSTSDASTNVSSFSSKDSLTREQAHQLIQQMMGKTSTKDEASQSNLEASLSQVCKTSANNKQVATKNEEEVKSEEITTQEVTLVFSWPKKEGMPSIPKTGFPFREIFLHRVTRISDTDKEVIEGPTIETIEYGKSKGKISGIEYEKQKSIRAANKTAKALPSSTTNVKETSTQSDSSLSHSSKFASDVEEVTVISRSGKFTTIATQTIPARIIRFSTPELSLSAIKTRAESAGITVDASATSHTENIVQTEEDVKVTENTCETTTDNLVTVDTGEKVVHEDSSSSTTTTTTTVVTTTELTNASEVVEHKHTSSSSSSSSGSGSTGSIVDLHASQPLSDLDVQEMEEAVPSNQELENVAEQQVVPPRFTETIAFSESRDMNIAKVESQEQPSVVEEFFPKSEPSVFKPAFCEQYSRDEPSERRMSEPSDDKELEGAIEGMQVVYPSGPDPEDSEKKESTEDESAEPIEVRKVSMQHIMETLQKRMESLGYDLPMPDLSDVDTSKSKEQHLDLVWTEEDKRLLEETLRSSQTNVSEVKPKDVYEVDASRFFSSTNTVEVTKHTETETKREIKDIPLLTKVRLIAYMSDAERELIKSLIEFCRIIEQLGEQKDSGRQLDVIPEGLELTVQPGVGYSDCLPSPESRKAATLHSPSSTDGNTAEKAFEDTLAVIEKTKQFVNETDFSKPKVSPKPKAKVLRDTRTPSTDDDIQSAQCTNILESQLSAQESFDSCEETTNVATPVRRVSVSGLYRDLIDVVMPLKTEKSVSQLTTQDEVSNEITTQTNSSSAVTTQVQSSSEMTTQVQSSSEKTTPLQSPSKPTSRVQSSNEITTKAQPSSEMATQVQSSSNTAAEVQSSSEMTTQIQSSEVTTLVQSSSKTTTMEVVTGTHSKTSNVIYETSFVGSQKGLNKAGAITSSSEPEKDGSSSVQTRDVRSVHGHIGSSLVDHYAEQVTEDLMKDALEEISGPNSTSEVVVTKIALLDEDSRKTVDLVEGEDVEMQPKKVPPPVPPRPKCRSTEPKRKSLQAQVSVEIESSLTLVKRIESFDDTEEKIFLVRSDEGSKYEVESSVSDATKPVVNNKANDVESTSAEREWTSLTTNDNSADKILLVGRKNGENTFDSKSNVPLEEQVEIGESALVMSENKYEHKSCDHESLEHLSLSPDAHSPVSPDEVNCFNNPSCKSPSSGSNFANILYAELVACQVMQDSMAEMELFIEDGCDVKEQNSNETKGALNHGKDLQNSSETLNSDVTPDHSGTESVTVTVDPESKRSNSVDDIGCRVLQRNDSETDHSESDADTVIAVNEETAVVGDEEHINEDLSSSETSSSESEVDVMTPVHILHRSNEEDDSRTPIEIETLGQFSLDEDYKAASVEQGAKAVEYTATSLENEPIKEANESKIQEDRSSNFGLKISHDKNHGSSSHEVDKFRIETKETYPLKPADIIRENVERDCKEGDVASEENEISGNESDSANGRKGTSPPETGSTNEGNQASFKEQDFASEEKKTVFTEQSSGKETCEILLMQQDVFEKEPACLKQTKANSSSPVIPKSSNEEAETSSLDQSIEVGRHEEACPGPLEPCEQVDLAAVLQREEGVIESEPSSGSESPSPPASCYLTFVEDAAVADELSPMPYDSTPDPDDFLAQGDDEMSLDDEEYDVQSLTLGDDLPKGAFAEPVPPVARLLIEQACSSASSTTSDLFTFSESDVSPYPREKPKMFTSELASEFKMEPSVPLDEQNQMGGSMDLAVKPLPQIVTQGMKELSSSESAVHDLKQLEEGSTEDHDALPYKPLYASAFQLRDDDDAAESRRFLKKKACDLRNIVEEQSVIEDKLSTIKGNFTKLLEDVGRMKKAQENTPEWRRRWSVDLSRFASESEEEERSPKKRSHRSRSLDNAKNRTEVCSVENEQTEAAPEKSKPTKQKSKDIGMMIFSRVHSEPALHAKRSASADSDKSSSSFRSSDSSMDSGSESSGRRPQRRMYSRRWSDYNISQEFLDRDQADRDHKHQTHQGTHRAHKHRRRTRSHNRSYQRSFYWQDEGEGSSRSHDDELDTEEKTRLFKEWFYRRYKERGGGKVRSHRQHKDHVKDF